MNYTRMTDRLNHFAALLSAAANTDIRQAVLINKRSGDALVRRGIAREVTEGYVATHDFLMASVPGYHRTDEAERGSIRAEFHGEGYCGGQHGATVTEDEMTSCEWDIAIENDEVRTIDLARVGGMAPYATATAADQIPVGVIVEMVKGTETFRVENANGIIIARAHCVHFPTDKWTLIAGGAWAGIFSRADLLGHLGAIAAAGACRPVVEYRRVAGAL